MVGTGASTDDETKVNRPASTTKAEATAQEQANPTPQPQDGGNPYNHPTDFVGFDQYYNANAGAAKKAAGEVNQKVVGDYNKATQGLQQAYGAFNNDVSKGIGEGSVTDGGGEYAGPGGFDPSEALRGQYQTAEHSRDALGTSGGIQALMPGGTGLGGALTQRAGAQQFAQTQKSEYGLDGALDNAQSQGAVRANSAAQQTQDNYDAIQAAIAEGQRAAKPPPAPTGPSAKADPEDTGVSGYFGQGDLAGWWRGVTGADEPTDLASRQRQYQEQHAAQIAAHPDDDGDN